MIWQKYEKCVNYLNEISLVNRTNENWDFYLDNQWNKGQNTPLDTNGVNLPFFNIIKSSVKFQTSTIAQNSFMPTFKSVSGDTRIDEITSALNRLLYKEWKSGKQKTRTWRIIKEGLVQGDSYQYCGTDDPKDDQIIQNTNIMFGDEGNPCIQEQPYIIIRERLLVSDIKAMAKENGISKEEIDSIKGDREKSYIIGDQTTSDVEEKCTSILYLEKKDGVVWYARATKGVVWQPLKEISAKNSLTGEKTSKMTLYPIASYMPEELPSNARGKSSVRGMIPNQIEINKTLVRRSEAVKIAAYPRLAYNSNVIQNEEDLDKAGAKIALDGMTESINQNIAYLNAVSQSPDAANLQSDLIQTTRELSGSVDAITGATDPTRVSGAAVIAMRDQSALPLNEAVDKAKQFIEDLAAIWLDMKKVYNPNGVSIDGMLITSDELQNLEVEIDIDVSQDNPWTKQAEQGFLDNLFDKQQLSLQEYVDLAPDQSIVPKAKMLKMFAKRQELQAQMPPQQMEGTPNEAPMQSMPNGL